MKLLDCTLRDGGYYTNWDFDEDLVKVYADAMENLPVEYIEVGYRSVKLNTYLGKYFYTPLFVLERLKTLMPSKRLAIILNEKDVSAKDLDLLLQPIIPYVDMIRVAVDPNNFKRGVKLAKSIKKYDFELAFNVMYMSRWKENSSFLEMLSETEGVLDYFYMVDSFGGILPTDIEEIINIVKSETDIPIGFHGHDNLQMGLINTITALDNGCEIVDSTITGMGRGAGNLKTELLLTFLDSQKKLNVDFKILSEVVSSFEKLRKDYEWGTSLPYMFSGAYSLPQKQVMEWVGLNRYSISSILNALDNRKNIIKDNVRFPLLNKNEKYRSVIILGGGESANIHKEAIKKLLNNNDICLIHAGVKNIKYYLDANTKQYYALLGVEEEHVLEQIITKNKESGINTCVFPPYPRKMGVSIPDKLMHISEELKEISFTSFTSDSPLAIAIQCALDLNIKNIYLAGFDGYDVSLNKNQFILAQENQKIIDDTLKINDVNLVSLTLTKYRNIEIASIYSLLSK